MLAPVGLAIHQHEVASAVIALVGLIALVLAGIGIASARRSENPGLRFVVAAFVVFGLKGLFAAWAVYTGDVAHEDLELITAVADLAVVVLLVLPLFRRARP